MSSWKGGDFSDQTVMSSTALSKFFTYSPYILRNGASFWITSPIRGLQLLREGIAERQLPQSSGADKTGRDKAKGQLAHSTGQSCNLLRPHTTSYSPEQECPQPAASLGLSHLGTRLQHLRCHPPFQKYPDVGWSVLRKCFAAQRAKQAELPGPIGRPNSALLPHSGRATQASCPPLLQLTNPACASAALAGRTGHGTGRWRRCWRRSFSPPPLGLSSHFWLLSSTLYRIPGRKKG